MDLGDLGKMFNNSPMDKLGDVVDFFVDHRDDLDRLISIIATAPAVLSKVAEGLGDAGDNAKKASVSLAGVKGKGGAAGTLTSGAGTLTSIGDRLASAADLIGDIGTFMAGVEVPSVEPKFTKVAGVSIVSGIDVGKNKILTDPAKQLKETSASLADAQGDLAGLADNLADLAQMLTAVGGALDRLGDGLKTSGAQAEKVFG